MVLIPGTGVVYTVSTALTGGQRQGFIAAFGCTLGIVPHLLAAVLGLSGVMQAGAAAFEVVRWAGVIYLAYLGIVMIRSGGALNFDGDDDNDEASTAVIVRRGIVLNLLNPKLTLFFFAFLPQFLNSEPRVLDPRLIGLATIFMAMTFVVFVGYATLSAAVRDAVTGSPSALRWIQRSFGALLVGFAARLALADR